MFTELYNIYANYQIPDDIKQLMANGVNLFGSLNFTKMMLFLQDNPITHKQMSDILAIRPERQPDELYKDYKNRLKLQNHLFKYKPYIFNYELYK